jgi:tetratricopeptide (TPR) repeat protein
MEKIFAPEDLPLVVRAYREVQLLWLTIQDEDFTNLVVQHLGADRKSWIPANLALVAMGLEMRAEELAGDAKPVSKDMIRMAQERYEEWIRTYTPPKTLAEAGWLALALRENRQKTGNWNDLLHHISQSLQTNGKIGSGYISKGQGPKATYNTWASVLVCLVGMISNRRDFLKALMGQRVSSPFYEWAGATIFSNVSSLEEQTNDILDLITELSPSQQLIWLRRLRYEGRRDLVERVASKLLSSSPDLGAMGLPGGDRSGQPLGNGDGDIESNLRRLFELERYAILSYFSGQPAQAQNLVRAAKNLTQYALAGIELQLMNDDFERDLEENPEGLLRALQNSANLRGELALNESACGTLMPALLESCGDFWSGQGAAPINDFLAGTIEPMLRLRQAKLIAKSGNIGLACEIAKRVTSLWSEAVRQKPDEFAPSFVYDWDPVSFLEIYQELGLRTEAIQFIEGCLIIRPNDVKLLVEYQKLLQLIGKWGEAKKVMKSLLLEEPENPEWHRQMAEVMTGIGDPSRALYERQTVMRLAAEPGLEDWLSLACAAERGNDPSLVVRACQEILFQDASHGGANALVGRALVKLGRTEEALEYLSKATLSAPKEPQPWLALADLYEQIGDNKRSIDTLRAATLAVPEATEVNFALGRKYFEEKEFTEALPYLQEAYRLSPDKISVVLALGANLRELGQNQESRQILSEGCVNWPQNMDLVVEYGLVCLGSGEFEQALASFEKALQLNPKHLDCAYYYAETLLGLIPSREEICSDSLYRIPLQRARKLLEDRISEIKNPPFKARSLLAEIVITLGESGLAYELYKALMDASEANQPEWGWRIQAGFGKAALSLGRNEEALAALLEASQGETHRVGLMQFVVEALLSNHLDKEAAETARQTIRLAPNNIDLLAWFADNMAKLGHSEEAVEALECTLQLDPNRSGNWLKLIEVHLRAGSNAAARTALQKFLLYGNEDAEALQKIAIACVRLEDLSQAVDCLERAEKSNSPAKLGILMQLARLYEKTGQLERSVDCLQKITLSKPEDPIVQVFQADILIRAGRVQAATACLEQALQLWESYHDQKGLNVSPEWNMLVVQGLVTSEWLEELSKPSAVHWRFARLYHQTGNWEAMQSFADNAVNLSPENYSLRYSAAECIASLLQYDRALKILEMAPPYIDNTRTSQGSLGQDYLAMRAELMLEMGRLEEAGKVIQQGLQQYSDFPRLIALKARVLARRGQQFEAEKTLEIVQGEDRQFTRWMAQALLEVGRFDEALAIFAETTTQFIEKTDPNFHFVGSANWTADDAGDPRMAYEYGRALVICAEQAILRTELKIEAHLPSIECLDEAHFTAMSRGLLMALKATQLPLVERWLARGRLVFKPSLSAAQDLGSLSPDVEDVPSLVMGLRRLNRTGNALQWAQKYSQDPPTLLQTALCTLKFDSANGLRAIQRAVELRPLDPIYNIGLALLAAQSLKEGCLETALSALNMASNIWPDEPGWHYWAAELASILRQELNMIGHLERAFVLRPQWFDAAYALGKAYLANHQIELAVDILNRAAELTPYRGDIWYTLATAYRQLNCLIEALVSAERASNLDQGATAALLLCGEVALELGRTNEAAGFARAAVDRDKNDVGAALFLIRVMESQGNKEAAFASLEEAIKGFPTNLPLLVERARLARHVKGAKQALPMIEDMMRQYPNEFKILQIMAEVQFECGNLDQAEKIAAQALELQPQDLCLMLLLGRIYHHNGQLDLAIRYFSDVIRKQPDQLIAHFDLGRTYQDRREYRKALGVYQKARELSPKDYRPYFESANVLKEMHEYQKAEEMLKVAAELAPRDVNIRKQLSAVMALNLIQNTQANQAQSYNPLEGEEVNTYL